MLPSPQRARVAACALAVLLAPAGVVAAPATDDAYHFGAWRDGRYDALYTEWWYFNLHDERAGVGAILSYFVTNPLDIRGTGQAQMVAVAYTAEGTVSAMDASPPVAFSADEREVRVSIDPGATIRVDARGRYLVSDASRDGRIAWDLAYEPEAEPWYAAEAPRFLFEGEFVPTRRGEAAYDVTRDGQHFLIVRPDEHSTPDATGRGAELRRGAGAEGGGGGGAVGRSARPGGVPGKAGRQPTSRMIGNSSPIDGTGTRPFSIGPSSLSGSHR